MRVTNFYKNNKGEIKMNVSGIRMLGLSTLLAGTGVLTSCKSSDGAAIARKAINNQEYVLSSGISAKAYDSMVKLHGAPCLGASMCSEEAEFWQKTADSIYWTKKLDSAVVAAKQLSKQAAIDSMAKIASTAAKVK